MKRRINILLLMIFTFIFNTSAPSIVATRQKRKAFVDETTIAGLVSHDEGVSVRNAVFDIDFLRPQVIDVDQGIETTAYLKIIYDLTYSGSESMVNFSFPFLSKLKFLGEDINILIDGKEINPLLNVSPIHSFSAYNSFTQLLNQGSLADYRENMLTDYQFQNDIPGYKYTVTPPKTRGKKYLVKTKLNILDIPENSILLDVYNITKDGSKYISTWHNRDSEKEFVFFSDVDLIITGQAYEIKQHNDILIDRDIRLEDPVITRSPTNLIKYISHSICTDYRFNDTIKKVLLYNIDEHLSVPQEDSLLQLATIKEKIINNYYEMTFDFDVEFNNPNVQVEINMPIPIHYSAAAMTITIVPNPFMTISDFENFTVHTHINEKLLTATESAKARGSTYECTLTGNNNLQMTFDNSSIGKIPYGKIFSSVFAGFVFVFILVIVLITIALFLVVVFIRVIIRMLKSKNKKNNRL